MDAAAHTSLQIWGYEKGDYVRAMLDKPHALRVSGYEKCVWILATYLIRFLCQNGNKINNVKTVWAESLHETCPADNLASY